MKNLNLLPRHYSILLIIFFILGFTTSGANLNKSILQGPYSCIPCGQSCDKEVYMAPGTCSNCQMPLVKTSSINFKTILPSQICDYITENPQVVLLDVRTKQEFDGKDKPNFGRLKNAINLPVEELESKLELLSAYKDKKIIVYCSTSRRSPRASYILSQNGFKDVTNLAGGMSSVTDERCKELN